jgi:hypothetical protein
MPVRVTPTATAGAIAYVAPSSVSFIDDSHGWVVGLACDANGSCRPGLARSDDGGTTWTELPEPPQRTMEADTPWPSRAGIYFTSASHGWLFNPYLDETTDGGLTWKSIALPTADPVTSIVPFAGAVWLVTPCSTPPCTTTVWRALSGQSFNAVPTPALDTGLGSGYTSALVANGRLILVSAWGGALAATTNGEAWTRIPAPCQGQQQVGASPQGNILDVCWQGAGGGQAPKEAWSSSDGGSHWVLRSRTADLSGKNEVGNIPWTGYSNEIAMPTPLDAWMSLPARPINRRQSP